MVGVGFAAGSSLAEEEEIALEPQPATTRGEYNEGGGSNAWNVGSFKSSRFDVGGEFGH